MKTTIVTLSLLMTSLAFAVPAAATCIPDAGTGTAACADVYDAANYGASASQSGVGGAQADAYEFTFFGMTQRGRNAFVYTESGSPVGSNAVFFSEFCFASPEGSCTYQDDTVFLYSDHAGFYSASVSQSPDGRMLCYSTPDTFACQPF